MAALFALDVVVIKGDSTNVRHQDQFISYKEYCSACIQRPFCQDCENNPDGVSIIQ